MSTTSKRRIKKSERTPQQREQARIEQATTKLLKWLTERGPLPRKQALTIVRACADPRAAIGAFGAAAAEQRPWAQVEMWAPYVVPVGRTHAPLSVTAPDFNDLGVGQRDGALHIAEAQRALDHVGWTAAAAEDDAEPVIDTVPHVHLATFGEEDEPRLVSFDLCESAARAIGGCGVDVADLRRLHSNPQWGHRWTRKRLSVQAEVPRITVTVALGLPLALCSDLDLFDPNRIDQVHGSTEIGMTASGHVLWGEDLHDADEPARTVWRCDSPEQAHDLIWRFATRSWPTDRHPDGVPLYRLDDFVAGIADERGLAHVTHTLWRFAERDLDAWTSTRIRAVRRGTRGPTAFDLRSR